MVASFGYQTPSRRLFLLAVGAKQTFCTFAKKQRGNVWFEHIADPSGPQEAIPMVPCPEMSRHVSIL